MQCCTPLFIKYMKLLECLQSKATKLGKVFDAMSPEEQLRTSGCHSSMKRRLRPCCFLQLCKVKEQEGDAGASLVSGEKMHGNGSK